MSEARYRRLFEDSPIGIVFLGARGEITLTNQRYRDFLGMSDAEIHKRGPVGIVHPDDWEPSVVLTDKLRSGEVPVFHREQRYIRGDGKVIWGDTHITALRDQNGRLIHTIGWVQDITERKLTDEALRESEERMRLFFERQVVGMGISDTKKRWIQVNDRLCQMLRYSREELLELGWLKLTHPDDVDADLFQFNRMCAGDIDSYSMEKRYIRKDGAAVYVNLAVVCIRRSDRSVDYMLAIMEDISERKQAEETLRGSEEKFRNLFNDAQVGMFRTRLDDSEILDCNERFLKIFGHRREEVQGSASVIRWAYPHEREEMLRRLNAEGHVEEMECGMLNKQGEEKRCLTSLRYYREEGILVGSIIDITDRIRAEEALRESEVRFRTILQTTNDGYYLVDQKGHFLDTNDAYCSMIGYSREEILQMQIGDIEAIETQEVIEKRIRRVMETGSDRFETKHRRKDGRLIDIEASVSRSKGGEERLVVFMRDITERKRAEEENTKLQAQLLQAQKMESVGRLAGGVAHDFNNMLGVILGHTEIALEQVDPSLPLHDDLEAVHKAAERSASLTHQLLAFARKQTAAPKVLDLNQTVGRMLAMLERLIGEDVQLIWKPAADLWSVKMDPSQVDQIMTNLCINARDAIADVGTITVETRNSEIDEVDDLDHPGAVPGEYVLLAVRDDGCGMDKETVSHLFEPFFTTKEAGKGTGLGLATVYGIVKQNDGFVYVDSAPGEGATFSIYLPRQTGEVEQARDQGQVATASRGQETILVVEDEAANLKLVRRMLVRQGYTVLEAGTPGEAIRIAQEHVGEIHLLMTDVIMPEMNGRDLASLLLSFYPHLKCLFMSGYTADVIANHGVLEEGVSFISKPFSAKGLGDKVRQTLT